MPPYVVFAAVYMVIYVRAYMVAGVCNSSIGADFDHPIVGWFHFAREPARTMIQKKSEPNFPGGHFF